ncbi:MAG: hypothetical protein JRF63_02375 [Deltaproteobacteria bacterium]|nr:hypothetical protein [Deltaproteobacteria bacterium]
MSDLPSTVIRLLRSSAGGRWLKICVICRGNLGLVESVLAEGHPTVVVGDRFRTLYSLHRRLGGIGPRPIVVIEAELDALPLKAWSLDALVLSRGLPSGDRAAETLTRLRRLLAPGGLLIWPHPISDGTRGRLGRVLVPARRGVAPPSERHRLCASVMQAGFRAVRQQTTQGGPAPWVVTTGSAGRLRF